MDTWCFCEFSWVHFIQLLLDQLTYVSSHMTGGDGHPEQLPHLGEMAAEASVSSALES